MPREKTTTRYEEWSSQECQDKYCDLGRSQSSQPGGCTETICPKTPSFRFTRRNTRREKRGRGGGGVSRFRNAARQASSRVWCAYKRPARGPEESKARSGRERKHACPDILTRSNTSEVHESQEFRQREPLRPPCGLLILSFFFLFPIFHSEVVA